MDRAVPGGDLPPRPPGLCREALSVLVLHTVPWGRGRGVVPWAGAEEAFETFWGQDPALLAELPTQRQPVPPQLWRHGAPCGHGDAGRSELQQDRAAVLPVAVAVAIGETVI